MSRLLVVVIAALVGVLLWSPLAFAIDDPDSVSIGDVLVFEGVVEDGDQLYFVRYDVSYNSTPDEEAEDTWQMALYDAGGALVATKALNYYQHNIISIYLDPAEALVSEGAHKVIIRGSPSVFDTLTEGVNMKTNVLAPCDYYSSYDLGAYMVAQAKILEDDWEMTLLTAGDLLNDTGSTYFIRAVPGLGTMAPTIFQTAVSSVTINYTDWEITYNATMEGHEGPILSNAISGTMSIFGVESETWGGAFAVSIGFLMVAGLVYAPTRRADWALIVAFPLTLVLAWLGVGAELWRPLLIMVLLVAILWGLFFILRHLG